MIISECEFGNLKDEQVLPNANDSTITASGLHWTKIKVTDDTRNGVHDIVNINTNKRKKY